MVIVGTTGIQEDRAQAHNLDARSLTAIQAPDESSDTDDEGAEDEDVVGCATTTRKAIDKSGSTPWLSVGRVSGLLSFPARVRVTSRARSC